ncbi:S41 family peptidase [Chitinophaga nivalis]|uniref:S41 family peptidase n=1 Tax=Chitinophaga nivalis TaxID=2991709 RepID=A0ABT3IRU2_9BACT|nr:S41 family peptidase [Chitinophaga nivalis]MCW3463634.1 S41 family peptidase [Chitinophaga nivalis]MCW3486676.1 S41 family peptidase [Chitinophaga nivalis]
MKRWLIWLCSCCWPVITQAQLVSPEEARQDMTQLIQTLKTSHPALYRFTPKAVLDRKFDSLLQRCNKPMPKQAFLLMVTAAVTAVRDGHTLLLAGGETTAATRYVPFEIRLVGGKAYVFNNYSNDPALKPGSEILAINKAPMPGLVNRMLATFSADGYNQTIKSYLLGHWFRERYQEMFAAEDSITLQLRGYQQTSITTLRIPLMTLQQMSSAYQLHQDYIYRDDLPVGQPYISVYNLDHDARVLSIRGFTDDSTLFNHQLDEIFTRIQLDNVKELIIDLRRSDGGAPDYAADLFCRLGDTAFPRLYEREMAAAVYRDSLPYRSLLRIAPNGNCLIQDTLPRFRHHYGHAYLKLKERPFTGKVHVLISGGTNAAGVQFAALVKHRKRGILYGEEAGSYLQSCVGEEGKILVLKHSGISIHTPLYRLWFNNGKGYNRNREEILHPDYAVALVLKELMEGTDTQLSFVKKKILADRAKAAAAGPPEN